MNKPIADEELDDILNHFKIGVLDSYELEHGLDPLTHEQALQKLKQLIARVEQAKRIGWTIELPDLPYFQIIAMDAKMYPYNGWKSPIYDTKNLPVIINDIKRRMEENRE